MADPARLRRLLNTLIQDAFEARAWGVVEVRLNAQLQADGVVAIAGRLDAPGADISSCDPIALELCQAIVRPLNGDITRAPSRGAGVQPPSPSKLLKSDTTCRRSWT